MVDSLNLSYLRSSQLIQNKTLPSNVLDTSYSSNGKQEEKSQRTVSDNIILSSQAQAILKGTGVAPINAFAQYFPTRSGSPANALALSVTNPESLSSSKDKTIAETAVDAKNRLDAKYSSMKSSGRPFDANSWEGKDMYELMGELDRRSLYAVRSNEGGLFTQEEQNMANSIMLQQQGLNMGLYSGPTGKASSFVDPYSNDSLIRSQVNIDFLDRVSAEEKMSAEWIFARSAAQYTYEIHALDEDINIEATKNPLVEMLVNTMRDLNEDGLGFKTAGNIRSFDDIRNQPFIVENNLQESFDGALVRLSISSTRLGLY